MKTDTEIEFVAMTTTIGAVLASTDSRVQIKTAADKDTYKITKDTVIVYIDAEEVEGSEGGSIAIAPDADSNNYCANVKFTANSDNELEVIFVAVNGQFGSEKIAH